jgi:hypothetical protein
MVATGHELPGSIELLRFTQSLCAASSLAELARSFHAEFPSLFAVPMYGLYVIEPWTGNPEIVASANVSDFFLARYEQVGREVDSLHGR